MPRLPSYKPTYSKTLKKWRIYIPMPEKTHGQKTKRKAGTYKTFSSREEAENFSQWIKNSKQIDEGYIKETSPDHAIEFLNLTVRAQELGFASIEALINFVETERIKDPSGPSMKDLADMYLSIYSKKWEPGTWSTWNTCIKPLAEIMHHKAAELDHHFWNNFFNNLHKSDSYAISTYNRTINYTRNMYKIACAQGILTNNPLDTVVNMPRERRHVSIVKPKQLKDFLSFAVDYHIDCVPYFALIFFAGARPDSEALRIRWEHIHWSTNEIEIKPPQNTRQNSKTKHRRFVTMEPCLRAWLEPFKKKKGLIAPTQRGKDKASDTIIKNARRAIVRGDYTKNKKPLFKWDESTRDISRHSYGSHFEAFYRDSEGCSERLRQNMGHTNLQTYQLYYKNTIKPKVAKDYWSIYPTTAQLEIIAKK